MIWGESYAGVYVPTLSKRVAEADPPLPANFLGFSVGNPCTADKYQVYSPLGKFEDVTPDYALNEGLINDALHATLTKECNVDGEGQTASCRVAWRTFHFLVSGLQGPAATMPGLGNGKGFLDNFDMGAYVGSMQPYWDATATYLNRADVRHALHVERMPAWGLFASRLTYHKQYLACGEGADHSAPQHGIDMLPIYASLVKSGHSILLYSGDVDPSVQWRGSELSVRGVGLPEGEGQGWRPWFFREEPAPLGLLKVKAPEWGPSLSVAPRRGDTSVLGGYIENFVATGGTLTFATVRGVGHMVPQFRPQASLHLFDRTMQAAAEKKGQPPQLAPPLPEDMLAGSTQKEFYGTDTKPGLMGLWLEDAQKLAYGVVDPAPEHEWAPGSLAALPSTQNGVLGSASLLLLAEVLVAFAGLCYFGKISLRMFRRGDARLNERLLASGEA